MDPINGEITHCANLLLINYSNGVRLVNKDTTYLLTFTNTDLSTSFSKRLIIYSGTVIIKNDSVVIDFKLDGQKYFGERCATYLAFQKHEDGDIVFLGTKTRAAGKNPHVYENFALIYNNDRQDGCCFRCIIIDPSIQNIHLPPPLKREEPVRSRGSNWI